MMVCKSFLLIVFVLLQSILFDWNAFAQKVDSAYIAALESDMIYKDNIRSLQFHKSGWEYSIPVIALNSNDKLLLSFDDLDADVKEYMFTIEHCDAYWNPSDLRVDEFIDGYYNDYIYEYEFSLNTLQPYTHYSLFFPTTDVSPKVSGNYILKAYVDSEDSLYFSRRFMVLEQKLSIEGKIKQASLISDRNYKQEVDFELNTSGYRIVNPYKDLKVIIMQNGRWDNAIYNLKPKMMVGNKLDFNYDLENVFNGGNEFRSLDIKSLTYNTENVLSINSDFEGYKVVVRPGEKRTFSVYKTEDDINGRMKIKTEDYNNSEIEAEYVFCYFSLPYPAPMVDGDFYIFGEISDWKYSDFARMEYNYKKKKYEKTLLLKQGFYDFQYVFLQHGTTIGDETFIEGNHSETNNQYTIFVYNRELGDDYDRLIGVKYLNTLIE